MGLIVPDGAVELLHLRRGDVGRIGDDHIEFSQKGRGRLPRVHLNAGDPAAQMEVGHVFLGHPQRVHRNVRERELGVLDPSGQGQTNAPGACAKIQDPGILRQKQRLLDGKLRNGHRVVPRDQHVGGHGKCHIGKIPLAQDIGGGLAREMALDEILYAHADLLGGVEAAVRDQRLLGLAGGCADQFPGHVARIHALRGQQGFSRVQVKVGVGLYHLSLPSCLGRTSSRARMATSIMESSGSLVVKFWNHMPGAVRIRVKRLS